MKKVPILSSPRLENIGPELAAQIIAPLGHMGKGLWASGSGLELQLSNRSSVFVADIPSLGAEAIKIALVGVS